MISREAKASWDCDFKVGLPTKKSFTGCRLRNLPLSLYIYVQSTGRSRVTLVTHDEGCARFPT